jgi:hypothetical protein
VNSACPLRAVPGRQAELPFCPALRDEGRQAIRCEELSVGATGSARSPTPRIQGLFILERVGSSPKAQVVPRLEDEGHWKQGTFPKTRKLEIGCGSNFMCKLKKKCHGPLSRWADFFKWSYPYGLYLDLPCSHWFSSSQHSLTSACADFFYLCHFWAIFLCFLAKVSQFCS